MKSPTPQPHPATQAAPKTSTKPTHPAPTLDASTLAPGCHDQIAAIATSTTEEIRITELVVLLADLQAEQAEQQAACLRRCIYPQADAWLWQQLALPTLATLQAVANQANSRASLYRVWLKHLRSQPGHAAKAASVQNALHAFDHFIFPLGALLQALPGDITNQPSLTHEQREMCESVAALSYESQETLFDGIAAIGALLAHAGAHQQAGGAAQADTGASADERAPTYTGAGANALPGHTLAHAGKLLSWLTSEARFMGKNAAEYSAAACSIAPCHH